MFNHPTTVIFLTKGIAHITYVANHRIIKTIRQEWNTNTLPKLFAAIKAKNTKSVRILLADEFSYILELTIPTHVLNKRLYIEQQLKTHIPEVLRTNEWDYKEVSKSKEKKALVFAPVKYVYDALLKASDSSGLHIEAVEPVQIAGKRHKNPIVGLAIKNDLKGKDEEVLNIVPTHYTPTDEPQNEDEDEIKNSGSSSKTWVLLLVAILIIGGCAYVIYFQFTKPRNKPSVQQTSTETATPSATLAPTIEPTATETPLEISNYTVRVLNGSGVAGASTEVKDLLDNEGFKEVVTGNADTYDYTDTVIRYKSSVPSKIIPFLSEVLNEYTIEQTDPLTTEESYDVLIIVGKKI